VAAKCAAALSHLGYPWLPALYIVAAVVLMPDLLVVKPRYTWPGLLIVASGVPIYALFRRREIIPSGVQSVAAGD
jgi:basic amino acid/polyamine antiporter, APA family